MGVVYLAKHRTLLRRAALKLVLPRVDDTLFRRRFLREARVLAEFRHPNIVEVYDFDVNDWGVPYYVMEYLEGMNLRQLLHSRGRLGWSELGPVLDQVASGLASIHRHAIVHRDLKPENIFVAELDDRRIAKVLDFGIAKATGGRGDQTHLTETGLVVGTVNYLSPEQILDDEVGPATDQYALALVVAELLTGNAVRAGKTLARIISDEIQRPVVVAVESLHDMPSGFSDVLQRATMPEAGDRFPDVTSFVAALHEVAAVGDTHPGIQVTADVATGVLGRTGPEMTITDRPSRKTVDRNGGRRRPGWYLWLGFGAVVVTLATLLLTVTLGSRSTRETTTTESMTLVHELRAPLDVDSVLTMTREAVMLGGLDGIVVQSLDPDRQPTRVMMPREEILGSTPDGELVVRDGETAVLRRLTGQGDVEWAQGLPAGEVLASPDTRWVVAKRTSSLEVYRFDRATFVPAFDIPLQGEVRALTVGTRLLAGVVGNQLRVWSLDTGAPMLDMPFTESSVSALVVHDDAELVAIGGWFDHVLMVDLNSRETHSVPRRQGAGEIIDLEFLLHGPTLAVGEKGGVALWRPGEGAAGSWQREGAEITDLAFAAGRLIALDRSRSTVLVFRLGGAVSERVLAVGRDEPWTAVADPTAPRFLIGNADGGLRAVDLENGDVSTYEVHTLGITSLVTDGALLASASDDKTIAVWRLPDLTVQWRSRAHGFLVNQLFLRPEEGDLWSTSSDRSLKRWSWPSLEELETVTTAEVLGQEYSLAALWVAPDGGRVVLGTWNRAILVLERTADGSWSGVAHPFDPFGGYVIAHLEPVSAVVIAGILHPFALAVYDLENGGLSRLRGANRAVRSVVAVGDGSRLLGFADNEILDYRFRRAQDGRLHYRMAAAHHPDLGITGAAAILDDARVAAANEAGDLHIIATDTIVGEELCDVAVVP